MPRKDRKKETKKNLDENASNKGPINPFALSVMFLNYCIENDWLVREQKGNIVAYYITDRGRKELPKFGIDISQI